MTDEKDAGLTRRELIGGAAATATLAAIPGCTSGTPPPAPAGGAEPDPVLGTERLAGFPWPTWDPFLFCVHHDDAYPHGNEVMGPAASLSGRNLGQDFEGIDGWRMYHGDAVPGFPQHPHRGFETVTVVRRGYIDHSDSLGAKARYGGGDTQWLTAGGGIQHAEMFPLLSRDAPNPVELFQIWLNLPRADKHAPAHFAMLWREDIPVVEPAPGVRITVVAGALGEARPPSPPPRSWAARPDSDVAIWTIALAPGARYTLAPAAAGTNRTLYFFDGRSLAVGPRSISPRTAVRVRPGAVALENGDTAAEVLLLQGKPIGEPVATYGPFVMNTRGEIEQAFADYRRTQFGGWPHPTLEPVHPRDAGRFARHADGTEERRG